MNLADDATPDRIRNLTDAIDAAGDNAEELTRLYIERGHCYNQLGDAASSVNDFLSALDLRGSIRT